MDATEDEIARMQEERRAKEQELAALASVSFDKDLYGGGDKDRFAGYEMSIPVMEDEEEQDATEREVARKLASYTAPKELLHELPRGEAEEEPAGFKKPSRIIDREDDYRRRRLNRIISPDRHDAFAMGDATPDAAVRTYADVIKEEALKREKEETLRQIAKKKAEEAERKAAELSSAPTKAQGAAAAPAAAAAAPAAAAPSAAAAAAAGSKRRNRWDVAGGGGPGAAEVEAKKPKAAADWDAPDATPGAASRWDAPTPGRGSAVDATPTPGPRRNRWDETPSHGGVMPDDATPSALPGGGGATPGLGGGATPAGMAWDATPKLSAGATPTPKKTRSRWDETPAGGGVTPAGGGGGATPSAAVGMTPSGMTPGGVTFGGATPGGFGVTPVGGMDMATPTPGQIALRGPLTPEQFTMLRWEREIEERNKPLSDEELDAMFPLDGYKVLEPPASYVPIRTPARKLLATPTPMGGAGGGATPLYAIPEEDRQQLFDVGKEVPGLPNLKPEDYQYFGALLNEEEEEKMSAQEKTERKIMKLLLKVGGGEEGSGLGLEWERGRKMGWCGWDGKEEVKNGTPPQRKTALRQLTDKAREFGASALFNQILPLLMSPTLEDQERHLLVKVIDRILYKLDELVRPFVHKILVVIEPLLIDEDYYARVEGREIISNLSKAAGLATMIAAMRPDIDNVDEAVCASKKSWQARHTGIKIVQQIAILMGCAVLPHLRSLVDIIEHGLGDDNQKVRVGVGLCMCVDSIIELSLACSHRTITSLSLAAIGEASAPYSIESFYFVLSLTTIPSMSPSLPSPPSPLCLSPPVPITCPPLSHLSPPVPITCPPLSHLSPPVPITCPPLSHLSPPVPITCPPLSHLSPPVPITCPPLSHLSPPVPITCPPPLHLSPPVPITCPPSPTSPHLSPSPVPPSPTSPHLSPSPVPPSPTSPHLSPSPVPPSPTSPHLSPSPVPPSPTSPHLSPSPVPPSPTSPHLSPSPVPPSPTSPHLSPSPVPPSPTSPRLSPSLRCALSQRSLWQRWQRRQHSLAEASAPYGIESFDSVLKPLWKGIRAHRGKVLAAFLKAIGFIIPLMDAMYASYYTREGAHGGICVGFIIPLMDAMYASYYTREVRGRWGEMGGKDWDTSVLMGGYGGVRLFIIPLMDAMYASYCTHEVMVVLIREFQSPDKEMKKIVLKVVMVVLIREFQSPDEEMKKIVLKVVKQCVGTDGVEPDYIRTEILPEYFKHFWVRRMALDRRNYKQLVETTVEIANKVSGLTSWVLVWGATAQQEILPEYFKHFWVRRMALDRRNYKQLVETMVKIANKVCELGIEGGEGGVWAGAGVSDIIGRVVEDLKDESEPYRRMTVEKVLTNLGAADIDARLEELLIDGILYAFQERICGTVKWRLNNKSAKVRQQAADLIARIAVVMKACGEEQLMGHLGVVLYEYLGEECGSRRADLIARIAVVMKACGEEQLMGHLGVVLYEAVVMKACGEEQLMRHLGVVLCEYLGEEYPEVLGSILGALKAIGNVIGHDQDVPPPCYSFPHAHHNTPNAPCTCATLLSLPLIPPEYPEGGWGLSLGALKAIVNVIGIDQDDSSHQGPCLPRLTPNPQEQAREGSQAEPSFLQSVSSPVQKKCIADRQSEPSSLQSVSLPVCVLPTPLTPPPYDFPTTPHYHSQVQENCIDLVGRIADRGAEFVPAREWMRICFELLDMLKAHKKGTRGATVNTVGHTRRGIRRATVNTFGYIAKAIGPQDVLATLLNNLKVQERQNRVCTTVAIAIVAETARPSLIEVSDGGAEQPQGAGAAEPRVHHRALVAETCSSFTVLPALMSEYRVPELNVQNGVLKYRVPELNVQNGVLKSLSFLFEYIGEMGRDYIYAVTPLLEDALMDRDLVHRQVGSVW
ncbi:unnamed protein product [Closterium sp. NIES-64]|nr:unnamed protein product [Closterium sp. NIES-64]